uniref:non-specific serine/threonine protein kinase n=1 Tax=Phaeomonas parva TaxID=124430 RepID=A0A7S1XZR3_9STRA|mmetsp:Transcript_6297/g.17626  ORF Transcript_6297/g.17626 Transcript_6297/m.17626 type:complete len:681 (+) Transcript_6297:115-2157(+)
MGDVNTPEETSPTGRFLRYHKRLGRGAYKTVYKAYDTEEGVEVAWNVTYLEDFNESERRRIYQEIALLKECQHQHIITYVDSWLDEAEGTCVFITELMPGGSLRDFVKKIPGGVRYNAVKRWCRQILSAIQSLHQHDPPIIHRDLKLDNFMYDGATGSVRLGDFGLSTPLSSQNTLSSVGTPIYMAPEMWGDGPYSEKVDIYAFGMSVLEMISGITPFYGLSFCHIYTKVVRQREPPKSIRRIENAHARDFIYRCINYFPEERPTATELLQDEFFNEDADEEASLCVMTPLPEGHDSDYYEENTILNAQLRTSKGVDDDDSDGDRWEEKTMQQGAARPRAVTSKAPEETPPREKPRFRRTVSEPPDAHAQRARIKRHNKPLGTGMRSVALSRSNGAGFKGVLLPLAPSASEDLGVNPPVRAIPTTPPPQNYTDLVTPASLASPASAAELETPPSRHGESANAGVASETAGETGAADDAATAGAAETVAPPAPAPAPKIMVPSLDQEVDAADAIVQMLDSPTLQTRHSEAPVTAPTGPKQGSGHRRARSLGKFGFVRQTSMTELRTLHKLTMEQFLQETRRVAGSTHTLAIRIVTDEGTNFELEFPFDTEKDTPESIALELMDGLQIDAGNARHIEDTIREAIDHQLKAHEDVLSPPAVSVPMHVVLDQVIDDRPETQRSP